jgi:hypothetical protein
VSDPVPEPTPPRWFDLLALVGPVAIASVGTLGLLLAILGVYSTSLALALGLPTTVAMVLGARRVMPLGPSGSVRGRHGAAATAAVVLAVGYLVFAGSFPSQNVIATRDPGLYMGTAKWLTAEGDLRAEARGTAFGGIDGLNFGSAGVYDMGDGELEFQFNHLASVVMAVGHDVGGYRLLLRMSALASAAGLLAVYAVAVRVTARPWVSLIAPALLALGLPLLFVSRNTYSEPFAFALLWGAAMVLADLHRRPRLTTGIVGGFLLGALVPTRVDALIYVALIFPFAALSVIAPADAGERRARTRSWLAVMASGAAVATIGVIDLLVWTGDYAEDLAPQLAMLRAAVAASAIGSVVVLVVWRAVPATVRLYERNRNWLAGAAAALIVTVLAAGWLLRPRVQVARGGTTYEPVRNIQRLFGMAEDANRTYAEDSLRWMGWYLGEPALVAAIIGLAVVAYLALRRGTTPAAVGVLGLTLASGLLYWWNPSITPDHLWATRRFVPAVLPGLAVMAVVPVAVVASRASIDRRVRHGAVALLALALLVPPAMTTWPLRWQRTQYGYLNPVREACDMLPEDAAVVVLGGYAQATLLHTLRSWCEVPVAGQGDAVDGDSIVEVAEQVRRNGHRLTLLSMDPDHFQTFLHATGEQPQATNAAQDRWLVQPTVDRPPDSYVPPERTLPGTDRFTLHVLVVDAP